MYLRKGLDLDLPVSILVCSFGSSSVSSTSNAPTMLLSARHFFCVGYYAIGALRIRVPRVVKVFWSWADLIKHLFWRAVFNINIAREKMASKLHNEFSNVTGSVSMIISAICDILIAIAMALCLRQQRSGHIWWEVFPARWVSILTKEIASTSRLSGRTKMLVSKLITYFVGVGALTRSEPDTLQEFA
ncbi:hypothetical protein ONZ45_g18851 [Pleurotus djamor]|nr:hypothetical protein ONZ45_g18851 [Pleurotus djamor]